MIVLLLLLLLLLSLLCFPDQVHYFAMQFNFQSIEFHATFARLIESSFNLCDKFFECVFCVCIWSSAFYTYTMNLVLYNAVLNCTCTNTHPFHDQLLSSCPITSLSSAYYIDLSLFSLPLFPRYPTYHTWLPSFLSSRLYLHHLMPPMLHNQTWCTVYMRCSRSGDNE